jgi:predicted PurR-regulated permease PerM
MTRPLLLPLKEPSVPRVVSFFVLVAILLIIGAIFFRVMAAFFLPLFLAAVLVVIFKPLHMWVREKLPGRLRLSALVTTVLIMLVVLLPLAFLGWKAYVEGRVVVNYLSNNRGEIVEKVDKAAQPVVDFINDLTGKPAIAQQQPPPDPEGETVPAVDAAQRGDAADSPALPFSAKTMFDYGAKFVGELVLDSAQGLLRTLFGLIIMVLALYYFLVDGPSMIHTMMRLSPLENEYERELLDKFANVSRAVVVASLAAAIVQGLLAGIGFYFALTPAAPIFLLTMITMVLAVVPFVGAAGVWIPTCLWIFFYQERIVDGEVIAGDPAAAIGLAVYCACVVSTIDNVIKPYVLHGQSNLHPLLALMSILGGVKALGPVGILVGPMLVAFIHALLVMVNKELRLLGTPGHEPRYDKFALPMHPGTKLEAEAAGGAGGGTLVDEFEEKAEEFREAVEAADQPAASPPKVPGKGIVARAAEADKRRRRRRK